MIDFSTLKGLTIPEGNVKQITDANGRVLWSATIKFTINGDTYIADRGMTWAEWFASDYNTTGKTADDVKSVSANGISVELNAVIIGGTAYEVGFAPPVPTITFTTPNSYMFSIVHNGTKYTSSTTFEVATGDVIECAAYGGSSYIYHNGSLVKSSTTAGIASVYNYTVAGNATIRCESNMGNSKMYITD